MNGLSTVEDARVNARKREPPLPPEYEAAILWSIRLSSAEATDEDRAAFRDWVLRSAANEQAWGSLSSSMSPFEVAGRRQLRRGGLAGQALRYRKSRRSVLRSLIGLGLAGTATASIANRFVPLGELTADHLTRTGQVEKVAFADGARLVLGPRTGVDVTREGAVRAVSLIEGEFLLESVPEALLIRMPEMSLSAARGSFVGRRRNGVSLVFAVDTPGLVSCNGTTQTLKPGLQLSFDGMHIETRVASASSQVGWVDGKLFAESETLARVVDRLRPYFVGIIRVDPAVARLSVTGLFPLDDLDLAFAALARALDVSVRHVTPFWVSIGPGATPT